MRKHSEQVVLLAILVVVCIAVSAFSAVFAALVSHYEAAVEEQTQQLSAAAADGNFDYLSFEYDATTGEYNETKVYSDHESMLKDSEAYIDKLMNK